MTLETYETVTAAKLEWTTDGGVKIQWSDGHCSVFRRAYLRAMCPCASCQGTHGPPTTLVDMRATAPEKPTFKVMTGPKPPPVEVAIEVRGAEPVGRYGLKLIWGDGHSTGIYTWRYLRSVSPGDGTPANPPTEEAKRSRPKAKEAAGL